MKFNIKVSTIARIGSLAVALINQCLITFGKDVLPFTENMAYQAVSLIAVIVIAAINAWYNNDISKIALICGGVFDALSDGKVSEDEIEKLLSDADDAEKVEEVKESNRVVKLINKIFSSVKKSPKE